MKFIIVGHGRHGKDSVSELINRMTRLTFESSSYFCCKLFIFDKLKLKYGYKTFDECYNDRVNHRSEWFQLISDYNKHDLSRLGREILDKYDIYCGLRSNEELLAIKRGMEVTVVWVDASKRKPIESSSSNTIRKGDADYIIDNNTCIINLQLQVLELMRKMGIAVIESPLLYGSKNLLR
jgi:hypothetical protein